MNTTYGPTNRFALGKTPPGDPYLEIFTHSKSLPDAPADAGDDELNEDDVFWTGDFSESSHRFATTNSSLARPNYQSPKSLALMKNSGILAATDRIHDRSVFNHKAEQKISASSPRVSSGSSSSKSSPSSTKIMIPMIPKKQSFTDRKNSAVVHQSAPVNVPLLSEAMRRRRELCEFDDIDGIIDDEVDGGEMLPPHELIAAKESPMLANSVLEGVGRTLKGRDLRQVRNAVWRKTGFID